MLNSDQPGESPLAGWADWRAELRLPLTPEWRTWLGVAGKDLSQLEFADFLEDHRLDVKDPDGATLLEIVTNITATRTAHFAQAQNLADGRIQFQVSEGLETRAGKAHTLTIPNSISLGLRPFAGGEAYRLDARLRYRINAEKGLSLSLRLDSPDDVIAHAFDQVVERITAQTGLPVYYGEPATPHLQLLRHQQSAAPQSR